MRRCLSLPFSLLVVLSCASPRGGQVQEASKSHGPLAQKLAPVGDFFRQAVARQKLPGALVFVERLDGSERYLETFGSMERERGRSFDEKTLIRIASMTKPITSTAVMMLVEEGKIDLDAPLGRYLPEWAHPTVLGEVSPDGSYSTRPARQPLTVRSLLTHTSGLSYRFMGPPLADIYARAGVSDGVGHTEGTLAEQSQKLAALPLLHEPGEHYTYSLSTDILGRVIEAVSGRPLDKFLEERIFEPLGMQDTFFYPPENRVDEVAVLYRLGPERTLERVPVTGRNLSDGDAVYASDVQTAGPRTYVSGGGGLLSTVSDYAIFLRMIANKGGHKDQRLLSPASVDLMTTNQIGRLRANFFDSGFGLGFAVNDDPARAKALGPVGTYFWVGIFSSRFWVDPGSKLIGICTSQFWDLDDETIDQCPAQVYQALSRQ
ncbi:serine hydrolase domain-containing protein [Hyalangium rubrum]|uniref:Serine hydrolase domain-containing protein n=1 Tax=Hyalangium rubrum TaxID=3103134 RepID=A0ABU5HCJ7_9BACT|nr:serine hydrolase domain-containing protein [Hyalangium sp. s54d21]MDY7231183.1 serine hydrolase domain-containing protein [Hyalangium sp. s54d21]